MRSIAIVCVRALAAYLILTYLGFLATVLSSQLVFRDFGEIPWRALVPPVTMFLVGVAVLLFSKGLAALALIGIPETQPALPSSPQLLQIGTALIGIFLVATALPSLVGATLRYFAVGSIGAPTETAVLIDQQGAVASFVRSIGSIVVGSLLLGMSRQVSALWRRTSSDSVSG
ncbi:MAG: hypothetical protein Q8R02_18580 [Hyphomonadaceae bacterium]|nr:hypothetical protein [Hyphomonadaceae bacterium]